MENLFNDQELLWLVIIFSIFVTLMCNAMCGSGVGEIRC